MDSLQHKRSIVKGFKPSASQVEEGELVINLKDKTLYTKDDSGDIISVGSGSGGVPIFVPKSASFTAEGRTGYSVDLSGNKKVTATIPKGLGNGEWVAFRTANWDGSGGAILIIDVQGEKWEYNDSFEDFIIDRVCTIYIQKLDGKWCIVNGIGETPSPEFLNKYPTPWVPIGTAGHASFTGNASSAKPGEVLCRWEDKETYSIKGIVRSDTNGVGADAPVIVLPSGYRNKTPLGMHQYLGGWSSSNLGSAYMYAKATASTLNVGIGLSPYSSIMGDFRIVVEKV